MQVFGSPPRKVGKGSTVWDSGPDMLLYSMANEGIISDI